MTFRDFPLDLTFPSLLYLSFRYDEFNNYLVLKDVRWTTDPTMGLDEARVRREENFDRFGYWMTFVQEPPAAPALEYGTAAGQEG